MLWTITKSGFRTKYKSCTKEIKGFINLKTKIIINNVNNDKYLNNNENIDITKKTKVKKKKRPKS
jgi:hypothetical protein